MQIKAKELLKTINEDNYVTAKYIAEHFNISLKTVRNKIDDLKVELKHHGASIESKPNLGYRLVVTNIETFRKFNDSCVDDIPNSTKERQNYIIDRLIKSKDYIKIDNIAEELCVNRNIISLCLRDVERIAKKYKITIDKKPNYGISFVGSEYDKRALICNQLLNDNQYCIKNNVNNQLLEITNIIRPILVEYELYLSEISFLNFIEFIYIQKQRINNGFIANEQSCFSIMDIGIKEIICSEEIAKKMSDLYKINYLEEELIYMQIHLASKKYSYYESGKENYVIKENIDRLVVKIISSIYDRFNVNMMNNLDVRMGLNQHLVPFDIRMKLNIPLANPMLDKIKVNYSFAYSMALHIEPLLEDYYHKSVPEDELAYLALIFQLALEQDNKPKKRDILIICSTGKSSSKLLMYKYRHEFGEYINNIYVTDSLGMHNFDYSKVSYVFSTIPLEEEISKPIMIINNILDNNEISRIKKVFEFEEENTIKYYYRENRMIGNFKVLNKDDAIKKICEIVMKNEGIDSEKLRKSVLERESIESTDLGNYIAIPHPQDIFSIDTIIYTFVLDKPIKWNRNNVQVIILTIIGDVIEDSIQTFYKVTSEFVLDKRSVNNLINNPNYETLLEMLLYDYSQIKE